MKFKSRKDTLLTLIIFGVNGFLTGITIYGLIEGSLEKNEYWTIIPISTVILLLFWIYFDTRYELNNTYFIYYSGPFRGKIKITRIKEAVVGTTVYIGFKPATAKKGILIKYDTYEEIYISPKTNESFVATLKELKKDIVITHK